MVALVLILLKKAGQSSDVSPISGSLNQNYGLLYQRFPDKGFEIEGYEPFDGGQLNVFSGHPRKGRFLLIGMFLLMIGILPGIVWLIFS